MWLKIKYSPTTLFSLKNSSATNSAGKSLLTPSPYSVKMALLNAIITYDSLDTAQANFSLIRDLEMRFSIPNSLIVNNCMIKIQKPKRHDISKKEKSNLKEKGFSEDEIKQLQRRRMEEDPIGDTVAFREYVYLNDNIEIAIDLNAERIILLEEIEFLKKWFIHINYFGKKGCFFQFISADVVEELEESKFCTIISDGFKSGVFMKMDDVDKKADFESMNNYNSKKKAKRINTIYTFPISIKKTSKTYSFYERI